MATQGRQLEPLSTQGHGADRTDVRPGNLDTPVVAVGPAAALEPPTGPAEPAAAAPAVAVVPFGKYDLVREVARGGMGVVYEARDRALGRVVALKRIRGGLLAEGDEVQRFRREAQAAAQLSHPHIVPVYEVGEQDGQHYFTMGFAAGGSLAEHRARFAEPRAAAALVEKVARAVHHAHEHGVLHRDLKPSNVLLDARGEPLVSDFGLAKFLDSDAGLTRTGELLGTPAYMAPEQASGRTHEVGVAADVWALGVLLYELVAGRRPFPGPGRDQTLQQIRSSEPARPGLDRGLETIILKCLAKDPAERYRSALVLADDLGRWLRGEPLLARPEGLSGRLRRTFRRNKARTVVTGALAAAAVMIAAALYVRNPDRQRWAIERALDRGEPVTLIGDDGPPRWLKWRYGPGAVSKLKPQPGQPFIIEAGSDSVVELLPDPRHGEYRFAAEIRHDSGQLLSEVGLAFGIQDAFCYSFTFNDVTDLQKLPVPGALPNRLEVSLRAWDEDEGRVKHRYVIRNQSEFSPGAHRAPEQPWRQVAVVVHADKASLYWEGQFIGDVFFDELVPPADVVKALPAPLKLGNPLPHLAPRRGLGLYLSGGTASVRRVVVEPMHLPD